MNHQPMGSRASRSGTASIELPDDLQPGQVGDSVRAVLVTRLAETGETLLRFDFGPPRHSSQRGMRSYDVMYRTEAHPKNL